MSTIRSSPAFGCMRPNRARTNYCSASLRSWRSMKRVAARRRYRLPAGRLTQIPDLHSLTASSRASEPHLERNGRIYRRESEPEDGKGPYSHDQLLQMNARFVQRLERAFANGDESRRC
jgi:hypothetical protein